MAEGDIGHQDAGAAAGDERSTTACDEFLQERRGERGADTGVDQRQPRPLQLQLIDRVLSDLADQDVDLSRAVEFDDGLDHILEEAQHYVTRDVDRIDDLVGLDDGAGCGIELQDRRVGVHHPSLAIVPSGGVG